MTPTEFAKGLVQGAKQLDLALDDAQIQALVDYSLALLKWNKAFNLSAAKTLDELLPLHLLDCLALVAALRRQHKSVSPAATHNHEPLRILDVGSGAGLPGIVLAITSEPTQLAVHVTTIDPVEKKIAFQRQVKAQMGLSNLDPIHGRVESLNPARSFDWITARAFASLGDIVKSTQHLRDAGSQTGIVAMKAHLSEDELEQIKQQPFVVEALQIPGNLQATRQLVWLTAPTEQLVQKLVL